MKTTFSLLFTLTLLAAVRAPLRGQEIEPQVARAEAQAAGSMITLSDFGAEDLGYLVLPQQRPKGGVVVVHDRWGLDDHIKALTDALAKQGFVAVAVDIYNGQTTTKPTRADELAGNVRFSSAAKTILAGARLLKTSPKLRVPNVAIVSYGMASPLALRAVAAQKDPLADALVMVEGPLENSKTFIGRLDQPVLGIYGTQRQEVPPHTVAIFEQMLRSEGVPCRIVKVNAGGDFSDPRSPGYNQAATKEAWTSMNTFLTQRLDRPPAQPDVIDKMGESLDKGLDSMKKWLP